MAIPGFMPYPDRNALMAAAAARIGIALRDGLARRGRACAALSGGTTPGPAYMLLAAQDLDWNSIVFALVDERCVPPENSASNEAMLRRALAPALSRGAQLLAMFAPSASSAEAASMADRLYAPLHFDIAVMGMGADAHTASWFPGAAGLAEALDPSSVSTIVALHAPGAAGSVDRLSLTRAALSRADGILLLITGADKRDALEAALARDPEDAPVAALFADAAKHPTVMWAP